jgi:non-homologous end joining protein Ku
LVTLRRSLLEWRIRLRSRERNEVRDAAAYFENIADVSATRDMTDLAKVIIQRMSGLLEPSELVERYEGALVRS